MFGIEIPKDGMFLATQLAEVKVGSLTNERKS